MAFETRDVAYEEITGRTIVRRHDKMKASVIAFWVIVECPHCHKPQSVGKWVRDNTVYDFDTAVSHECDLCDNPFEFRLQVEEKLDDPHLVTSSPSPAIEK
jgi:hypothetical protein